MFKPGARVRQIRQIILHHTGLPEARWGWDAIRRDHLDRGWSDIGYHYGIGADGTLHYGRDPERIGAHAAGANADTLGVAFIADLRIRPPTPDQLDALERLLRQLMDVHGLTIEDVRGHREVGTTSTVCPGMDPEVLREAMRQRGLR